MNKQDCLPDLNNDCNNKKQYQILDQNSSSIKKKIWALYYILHIGLDTFAKEGKEQIKLCISASGKNEHQK